MRRYTALNRPVLHLLPQARRIHSTAQNRSGFTNVLADAPAPAIQVKTITADGVELVDGKFICRKR
jgi:hypothetical protein